MLADFLSAVLTDLRPASKIVFFVTRGSTCLGIVGQTGYELSTITVAVA